MRFYASFHLLLIGLLWTSQVQSRIVIVRNNIQKAIDTASAGDTLFLPKAVYREGTLRITRPLVLIGADGAVLDGQGTQEILVLSGKKITIRGLRFQNAGYSPMNDFAAIKIIDADSLVVENNHLLESFFAIHISNSRNIVVRNNYIRGKPGTEQLTGNGIHLWKCDRAVIENNYITRHRDGIYFEFVTNSHIRLNTSTGNMRYGLHFMFSHNDVYSNNVFRDNGAGVAVMFSKNVVMQANLFEQNWGAAAYGILLKEITDSKIEHNRFIKNTIGLYMEGSNRISVGWNQFTNNGWAARVQASCDGNEFHHNNFQGNSFDIATNGQLVMNKFNSNYWDKYEGYDLNRDGVGDVPYRPVSLYAMLVEQNPGSLLLMRSFFVGLMDRAERAVPSLTPIDLADNSPRTTPVKL